MVTSTKTSLIFIDDLGFVNRNAQDNPIKEKQKNKHSRHTLYNLRLHNINAYGFQLYLSANQEQMYRSFSKFKIICPIICYFFRSNKSRFSLKLSKKCPFISLFFLFLSMCNQHSKLYTVLL